MKRRRRSRTGTRYRRPGNMAVFRVPQPTGEVCRVCLEYWRTFRHDPRYCPHPMAQPVHGHYVWADRKGVTHVVVRQNPCGARLPPVYPVCVVCCEYDPFYGGRFDWG